MVALGNFDLVERRNIDEYRFDKVMHLNNCDIAHANLRSGLLEELLSHSWSYRKYRKYEVQL
jgi:hypothetical protein